MLVERLNLATLSRLAVIGVDAPLRSAAFALLDPRKGLVVVCNAEDAAIGVITKSDLVRHLTEDGRPDVSVGTLMNPTVVSCMPFDDLRSAWETMAKQDLQNMPVLSENGMPIGVLDIRDAMKALFEQEEFAEHELTNYIAGIGYR